MRLFKNPHGEFFTISEAQSHLIRSDWIEVTSEEIKGSPNFKPLTDERIAEVKERLLEIDVESIRPMRAILTNTASSYDRMKLKDLNTEREELLKNLHMSGEAS